MRLSKKLLSVELVTGSLITAKRRANETELETVEHRASDRQCKAKWRANETEQETVECRASGRQC